MTAVDYGAQIRCHIKGCRRLPTSGSVPLQFARDMVIHVVICPEHEERLRGYVNAPVFEEWPAPVLDGPKENRDRRDRSPRGVAA